MTSLVALSTKDALVFGCDSLGTTTKRLIDPLNLAEFFDFKKDSKLKKDKKGDIVLKNFRSIYEKARTIPYTHMTHLSKLFSLSPLEMGIMTTGIASIGDRTIKSLIEEFKSTDSAFCRKPSPTNYTVMRIAEKIVEFISGHFDKEYPDERKRPYLEFILGGYDKRSQTPKVVRILFPGKDIKETLKKGKFGIVFGGQMKEIQRIVFGTDYSNIIKIDRRHIEILRKYRNKINVFLKRHKISKEIPELGMKEIQEFNMFSDDWSLDGFDATWGDFSEQNAIECVDFFVDIMVKSQQFSEGMPTVGGDVHIAIITKSEGFQSISREEYYHEGHFVSKKSKIDKNT